MLTGRLRQRTTQVGSGEPGTNVTRTFNELGHLTNESGTGTGIVTAARTCARDVAGRLTSVNASNGNFAFTYNDKNQVILGMSCRLLVISGPRSVRVRLTVLVNSLLSLRERRLGLMRMIRLVVWRVTR
jgi:hypothetical protein